MKLSQTSYHLVPSSKQVHNSAASPLSLSTVFSSYTTFSERVPLSHNRILRVQDRTTQILPKCTNILVCSARALCLPYIHEILHSQLNAIILKHPALLTLPTSNSYIPCMVSSGALPLSGTKAPWSALQQGRRAPGTAPQAAADTRNDGASLCRSGACTGSAKRPSHCGRHRK